MHTISLELNECCFMSFCISQCGYNAWVQYGFNREDNLFYELFKNYYFFFFFLNGFLDRVALFVCLFFL